MLDWDVVVVGAGIAGASLAWRLAPQQRVLLIEQESQPGFHSTGRSAAMFMESYGPPQARALTRASRAFYVAPPDGFTTVPIVSPRGALYVAQQGQADLLNAFADELRSTGTGIEWLDAAQTAALAPCLPVDQILGSVYEAAAMDLDVHALHQGFLRGMRQRGGTLRTEAGLEAATHAQGAGWAISLRDGSRLTARHLVNAAGAWADDVAQRCGVAPVGLQPKRRAAFTFASPTGVDVSGWPTIGAVDESWYIKPDAGRLLGSPANADPTVPHDVRPEELDIALGIDGIERDTTLRIARPLSTWAGLRSFVDDGELVIGWDDTAPGFFWLAGQGGYGIQSAAGASALAAALLCGEAIPEALLDEGVDPVLMRPARCR